jgi:hypothetical protein
VEVYFGKVARDAAPMFPLPSYFGKILTEIPRRRSGSDVKRRSAGRIDFIDGVGQFTRLGASNSTLHFKPAIVQFRQNAKALTVLSGPELYPDNTSGK